MAEIITKTLSCGMIVAVEPIANADSVALNWLTPAGSAFEPVDQVGVTAMLSEMLLRGAGGMTSRAFSDALDRLGVDRSVGVRTHHMSVFCVMRGEKLDTAIELIDMLVRQPALPEDALEPVRSLCLQSLDSLTDDPAELITLKLRDRHLPSPFNRNSYGDRAFIEKAGIEQLRTFWRMHAVPHGAILGVAGKVDAHHFIADLETRLADWHGKVQQPAVQCHPLRGMVHVDQETAQVHLALAFDAPPESSPDSVLERVGISVLSGSTSSRLFTEVRQKRSLCYSVSASYASGRNFSTISAYAGTTPQRAQETLDVTMGEFHRLCSGSGATQDEFDRAIVGLKSHLVMQGESTSARAGALAADIFKVGRPRSLAERAKAIDAVTLNGLNAYLASRRLGPATIASIGPNPMTEPKG